MKALLILSFVLIAGCAHSIHEVHISDFSPKKSIESGEMVKAQAEQFVILSFTQNTHYVDQAYNKLLAQCENGQVTGISTQFSTSLGFFSWTNKILMQGLCIK